MSEQHEDGKTPDQYMTAALLRERHDVRHAISIEIEVSGVGPNGEAFHERVFTRNVSAWGCAFLSPVEQKVDDIIALRMASPGALGLAQAQQSLFQVLRVMRENDGWLVGAWKMDSKDAWGASLEEIITLQEGAPESGKERTGAPGQAVRKDNER